MPVNDRRSVLKNLSVRDVMRKTLYILSPDAPIEEAIRYMIKYKVNAVLISDPDGTKRGVVSKTDVMGAYYAGIELNTPAECIMVGPPVHCAPADNLIFALEKMHGQRVHRVYVEDPEGAVVGVLAYPDIVGLLYRFCQRCSHNLLHRSGTETDNPYEAHITVKEVMSYGVQTQYPDQSLSMVMETLSAQRLGAVLIVDAHDRPIGVISKTDLMVAYRHGLPVDQPVAGVMNRRVETVGAEEWLMTAVRRMIFSDYHRVFVHKDETDRSIAGVLTLSDAAKARSGSCHACVASRVGPE